MAKKTAKAVCALLSALLLFGLMTGGLNASAVTQSQIDALEEEQERIKSQQADIQEQIDALQSEWASVMERKTALDEQTALNIQNITLIDQQIALYEQMIEDKGNEVDQALAAEELQFERYKARVRAMEETNTWTYLSILLKATSLTDFLSRLNDVKDILRHDKNMKAEYEAARAHVEQIKAEYEEIQEQQKEKREELLTEKARLERQVEQAGVTIRQLEDDIGAYTVAYAEKETEQEDIQARIDEMVATLQAQEEMERKAREAYEAALLTQQQQHSTDNATIANTDNASTGYYTWPCPSSTYISSKFGYHLHPLFGTTKYHAGIDIAASYDSSIVAAAGGTVSISEYSASYGYYCVIYHSDGKTTLYAHMNAMPLVSVGDTVTAGQALGHVGATGWATETGLRFEIRINGSCVDPLDYFPNISFTFATDD